ncbi:DUF262 domain-containing protein [Maribacter sp. MAR_2009_72]|uniref:DUF262 domain-containing protein n=1 Tax=Maribacter sp. MAR_2009_72 TaxID=1250050 RepID=UPI00119C59DC|nr:DUF262 domain-containing protein [Maribacter sp. MAR_2009_72]TVZ15977.1 uncharacterized protein DUF262 [Maribacter sp. MAR_2009_72]
MNNIGTADNEKLLDLYNDLKNGTLVLRPSFQRNLVWNNSHKQKFIDTILRGFPFPEIYLADGDIDLESQTSTRLVVDGQQRLDTIFSYINGEIPTREIPLFKDLSAKQQTDFYDYKIVVRDLGRLDENQIIEIFQRINSVSYALNAMEINNALYEGVFISTAQAIQDSDEFEALDIFSQNQYARMKDTEYILLIMATIEESGYFTGNSEIERYIKLYNDEYPASEKIKSDITETCKMIMDLHLEPDSLWFRKTSLFTLLVELVKLKRVGTDFDKINLKTVLTDLENQILENKSTDPETNGYAKFYKYVFQGTSGRAGRIARGTLVENEIKKAVANNG